MPSGRPSMLTIDAFNTRGIRTATTTKLGGLTQACFELLLLLQLEAVAMMAPLTSLNLLRSLSLSRVTAVLLQLEAVAMMAPFVTPLTSLNLLHSLSVPCDSRITGLSRAAKKKPGEAVLPCCCCDIWSLHRGRCIRLTRRRGFSCGRCAEPSIATRR